jgi:hypothetical protein
MHTNLQHLLHLATLHESHVSGTHQALRQQVPLQLLRVRVLLLQHQLLLLVVMVLARAMVGMLCTGLWWRRAGRGPAKHVALGHLQVVC